MKVGTVLNSRFAQFAPLALVIVVLLLGGTGVLAAATMEHSSDRARRATQLDRAYQDAAAAVHGQDFWVTEYLVRLAAPEEDLPAAKLRAEHENAGAELATA